MVLFPLPQGAVAGRAGEPAQVAGAAADQEAAEGQGRGHQGQGAHHKVRQHYENV